MVHTVTGSRDVARSDDRVSLDHFISDRCWTNATLARIVRSVSVGVKMIADAARRGVLGPVPRRLGGPAPEGSARPLKTRAHRVLTEVLGRAEACQVLASADAGVVEMEPPRDEDIAYAVRVDAIDEPSTIRDGRTAGTTFSVHRLPDSALTVDGSVGSLGAASEPILSGYGRYGPSTQFVVADQRRVDAFVLDPEIGTFFLVREDLQIPVDGGYAAMTGQARVDDVPTRRPRERRSGSAPADPDRMGPVRSGGSLVAHVHAILLRGGVVTHVTGGRREGGEPCQTPSLEALTFLVEAAGGRIRTEDSSQSDPSGAAQVRSSVRMGSPAAVRAASAVDRDDTEHQSQS